MTLGQGDLTSCADIIMLSFHRSVWTDKPLAWESGVEGWGESEQRGQLLGESQGMILPVQKSWGNSGRAVDGRTVRDSIGTECAGLSNRPCENLGFYL